MLTIIKFGWHNKRNIRPYALNFVLVRWNTFKFLMNFPGPLKNEVESDNEEE